MSKKRSWVQKRDEHEHPCQLKDTDKGKMFISSPREIQTVIDEVPEGKLITTGQIAEKLADQHGADFTCPLTTGIFVGINANAAEEELEAGESKVTPYWRVVKKKGRLYDKYLGQPSKQKERLEAEGVIVQPTGIKAAKYKVKNYEERLSF